MPTPTRYKARVGAVVLMLLAVRVAAARQPIRLEPEQRTTIRVGQIAIIEIAPGEARPGGSAGDALKLVKKRQRHGKTIFTYRAVRVGDETIVAAPDRLGPDGCISCVTVHYFVTVIR